ncbi:hypothetical protein JAAARDRAFT_504963 [Jaapia argillacea MUCL 33604]|uniref:Creatinase N-terminal domain-containing protein n=1 Tax=Jaapia argillacea MUCL 33604 TaxID=933084 RepID=A0A067PMM3_9AGAM|nr:hypothetical protein JAAARDRAFT_504963 [Jaapia argillacea MUCL 33604]
MSDRLTMLRRAMAMESTPLDYYIIPTHNAHGTVETNERRLQYISGFSGTSGLAIVSKTAGYLFVEPKDYDLAQKEVLLKHWFVIVVDAVYSSDYWASWLANRAENAVVGIDARLIQDDKAELLRSLLATKKSRIKLPSQNLIDRIWKDKSAGTSGVFSDKPLHIGPG